MSQKGKALKVLIAEDSKLIRMIELAVLKDVGITDVEQAHDGAMAQIKLGAIKYDMVILDWEMPMQTGEHVLQFIREGSGPNKDTPVLMVTGKSAKDEVLAIAKLGVNGYIVKPFTSEDLAQKLQEIIKKV